MAKQKRKLRKEESQTGEQIRQLKKLKIQAETLIDEMKNHTRHALKAQAGLIAQKVAGKDAGRSAPWSHRFQRVESYADTRSTQAYPLAWTR